MPRPATPSRRWRIAALLGVGVLVNYFDRVNLSVSHAALYTAFGVSNITFGYLSGAYSWTYAACQLPIGVVLDRYGVRRVGRISTAIWAIASFAAAASTGIAGLFGARFLLGIGEAPTFPGYAKAVGRWFPSHERTFATALFDSSAKLASAIGVPFLGVLLIRFGWRWSFAATGILSLLYLFLFIKIYKDPQDDKLLSPEEQAYISQDELPSHPEAVLSPAPLSYLLRQRKVLGLAIGLGAYNYTFYLLLTWLPSYLSFALHVDLLRSFLYTGVPWLIAFVLTLIVAWTTDRLIQRGFDQSNVRKTVLIVGTAFGLGILGAAHAHTATRALIWISLSLGGLASASPVGWSVPSLIVRRESVGSVGGIANFSGQLSAIAAPIVTGYIISATGSYAWAFGIAAAYLVIGIASYALLLGRIECADATASR